MNQHDSVYDVLVATEQLDVVARATGLEAHEHRLAAEDLAHIESGSRLVWRVTARLPDGRTIRGPSFLVTLE